MDLASRVRFPPEIDFSPYRHPGTNPTYRRPFILWVPSTPVLYLPIGSYRTVAMNGSGRILKLANGVGVMAVAGKVNQ